MSKAKEILKIFVSYSHKDMRYKNELLKHLKSIELTHNVDVWHDGKILPGGNIDENVLQNLNKSNIILLLISPDFLSSSYCINNELEISIKRYNDGECIVIPVILKECIIDDELSFSNLLRVPEDGKPIQKFRPQNNGYINALANIKKLIDENFKGTRKNSVKEPSVPISINLYQNGKLSPFVIDDDTWGIIQTLQERISDFQKIITEKLVDFILEYKIDFPKAKKTSNLDKFRYDKFKSFLLDVTIVTREWLFKDVGVRVHFRVLNKQKDHYIGFVAVDGKAKRDINVNWGKIMTPMSTTSGMIYHSSELNAPLIKSKNENLHNSGKNDDIYVDYITSALKFKDLYTTANPLMSMGISIEKDFNKRYAPYLVGLVFLKFDVMIENIIVILCAEIKKIDKKFELTTIIK